MSVNSQRNFSNSFIVDGLSANDDAAGLSGIFYGFDVVSEFQVVTSGGQAEFGRALGGYMNVVTKSGTNTVHGDLYGYFRNQRLNAANALAQRKLPVTQAQFGATLGGPVIRDRTFYFGNFEKRILNQSGLITIAPGNIAAINAKLDAVGYPGPRIFAGNLSEPRSFAYSSRQDRSSVQLKRSVQHSVQRLRRAQQKFTRGRWTQCNQRFLSTWTTQITRLPSATLRLFHHDWSTKHADSSHTVISLLHPPILLDRRLTSRV